MEKIKRMIDTTADCRLCSGKGKRLVWQGLKLVEDVCCDCNGTGLRQYTKEQIDYFLSLSKQPPYGEGSTPRA